MVYICLYAYVGFMSRPNAHIVTQMTITGLPKSMPTQQTRHICITIVQCRPNVFDVGPTLYKCYTNVLCLLPTTRCELLPCSV